MWFTWGYEELIIHDDSIELIQSFRVFSTRKRIYITEIKEIEIKPKNTTPANWINVQKERFKEQQFAFPFWYRMGQLILRFKGGQRTFFNGLSYEEAVHMKEQLDAEIEKRRGLLRKK